MNYYEILGVARDVSQKDLKKVYKKLAKKWHPDLNKDNLKVAEEKMREINVAYSTLSDEVARMDYDKKLDAAKNQFQARQKNSATSSSQTKSSARKSSAPTAPKVDFENIHHSFETFFGFDPKSKKVTNEDKLNTYTEDRKRRKNPLDTTDIFKKFMGF